VSRSTWSNRDYQNLPLKAVILFAELWATTNSH
jgi:hypothetical protein